MGNKVKYNLKNVHAAKLTEMVTDGLRVKPARSMLTALCISVL